MRTKRLLIVLAVASLVALAGCTGADDAGDGAQSDVEEFALEGEPDDSAPEDVADDAAADAGTSDADAPMRTDRRLIRTGEIRLTVDDFDEADATVRGIAADADGYVSDATRETRERDGDRYTVGEVVIRVPSESFDVTMTELETVGEVEHSSTESEDVTDQLTDLEARLENRRAERDRLRSLYEDAEGTEDVLAVQRELSNVQEEIERMEARQASLEDRVAMSTIRVRLSEEPPADEPTAWYDTGVTAAFLDSVAGVGTLARAAVVGVAYALPYVLAVGAPLAVIGGLARRYGDRYVSVPTAGSDPRSGGEPPDRGVHSDRDEGDADDGEDGREQPESEVSLAEEDTAEDDGDDRLGVDDR